MLNVGFFLRNLRYNTYDMFLMRNKKQFLIWSKLTSHYLNIFFEKNRMSKASYLLRFFLFKYALCLQARQPSTVFKILYARKLSAVHVTCLFAFVCTADVMPLTVIYYKYLGLKNHMMQFKTMLNSRTWILVVTCSYVEISKFMQNLRERGTNSYQLGEGPVIKFWLNLSFLKSVHPVLRILVTNNKLIVTSNLRHIWRLHRLFNQRVRLAKYYKFSWWNFKILNVQMMFNFMGAPKTTWR